MSIENQKIQKNIVYPKVRFVDVLVVFWKGLKGQRWMFFLCIFFIASASIFSVITPIFYKNFFDVLAQPGSKQEIANQLIIIIIKIALINAWIWISWRLATFLNVIYQVDSIARLKQHAYDYLMDHSYSFFANNFAGSLVQKVNRFAKAFETLTDQINWSVVPLTSRIIIITTVLYFSNKWITFIILIWAFLFLTFNILFAKWKVKYDIQVAIQDSKTTGYLADTITNQNTIQLFSSRNFESQGYKKVKEEQAKITKFSWHMDSLIEALQSFFVFAIEFALFYFAIKYWEIDLISAGFFVLLQIYIISLVNELWGFNRVIRHAYQAYADAKEMVEIMLLPHEIKDIPQAKDLRVQEGKIDFQNLTFAYNKTRIVLNNINIKIKSGERVALVGPSGSGKTTFVRLILRLYSPTAGKILIDDQDISQVTQESLRKNISMVPQDPILFHRTLAENIAYGKRNATREEIEEAAKLAHCDDFIKNLPQGLDTYVGERGIKLSGGERQRIAIARAILKNAPILILDEATSSLDSRSEMLIQDALKILMEGKTVIVIAHRLSTIQKMDRIIVIDQGKIVEEGNHEKLIKKENSLYRKLWELQAGGFLTDEEDFEEDEKRTEEVLDSNKENIKNKGEGTSTSQTKLVNF